MLLSELLRRPVENDTEISDICSDSRKCRQRCLFVAIDGTKQDGADFIDEAFARGAAAVLVNQNNPRSRMSGVIAVGSPRAELARICDRMNGCPGERMKLIAVTGTNGKTSVTNYLGAILNTAGHRTACIGTVTNTLTTPDPEELYPLLRGLADAGNKYVVMEASSHALALEKLVPLRFEIGIFTNLTHEHLDFHGDMNNYLEAKASLFRQTNTAILNRDDEYYHRMRRMISCDCETFSICDNDADYTAKNIVLDGPDGIRYELLTGNRIFRLKCRTPGLITVKNTLAASACALRLGIEPSAITAALSSMRGIPGRLERVPLCGRDFSVYIDFAHTPDALDNLLRCVRGFMKPDQRLTLLFGCGGDRDPAKRPIMGAIASRLADFTVITSDNSRSEPPGEIIRQIMKGFDRERAHIVIENRREAIEYAVREASAGEIILLAGKGHEKYEITQQGVFPFDEAEIVTAAACKRQREESGQQ